METSAIGMIMGFIVFASIIILNMLHVGPILIAIIVAAIFIICILLLKKFSK